MPKSGITVKGEAKRDRILAKALLLFNRHGVELVGVREIARALGMRPGHITYYFPDKDALVLELTAQLRALNDAVHIDGSIRSVDTLLERFERIMRNHIAYQGLLLSMARMQTALPRVRAQYRALQAQRLEGLHACFRSLVEAGELRPLTAEGSDFLVSTFSLISRGWIPESLAAGYRLEERVPHYLQLFAQLLRPYRP